jgi:hypothetical protein
MMRKVFCEILDGIIYEDRCLFKLSAMVDDKVCRNCILSENKVLKGKLDELKIAWRRKSKSFL